MSIVGIIPARYASSRFPGKPLADIAGKSMLQRVYEQSAKSERLARVVIATDDDRIARHAASFGAEAIMTSHAHPSGTDRCYEAYVKLGEEFDYVINIQGDEPFLHPQQIDLLAASCNGLVEIVTQIAVCSGDEQLSDPGEVKVVLNRRGEAMYFSRQPIPYVRGVSRSEWINKTVFYRHVGLYAYRADVLKKISGLQPSPLEVAESLEQLRGLEGGFRIKCVETTHESHCVDQPEDIPRILSRMRL